MRPSLLCYHCVLLRHVDAVPTLYESPLSTCHAGPQTVHAACGCAGHDCFRHGFEPLVLKHHFMPANQTLHATYSITIPAISVCNVRGVQLTCAAVAGEHESSIRQCSWASLINSHIPIGPHPAANAATRPRRLPSAVHQLHSCLCHCHQERGLSRAVSWHPP